MPTIRIGDSVTWTPLRSKPQMSYPCKVRHLFDQDGEPVAAVEMSEECGGGVFNARLADLEAVEPINR